MSLTQQQVQTASVDDEIISCVDRGLESVGHHVRSAVYWHLERMGHISKFEIPENPEAFIQGLRAVFRESSAGVERAILQEISAKFELNYSNAKDLVEAISELKAKSIGQ